MEVSREVPSDSEVPLLCLMHRKLKPASCRCATGGDSSSGTRVTAQNEAGGGGRFGRQTVYSNQNLANTIFRAMTSLFSVLGVLDTVAL